MHRRALMAAVLGSSMPGFARAMPKPVVLELFTSQGCSSCPPADVLLGKLAERPNVIALAWHVDYWDHLGWRDPYASRTSTARQRAYARALGSDVFTPALVVDGAKVLIGSQRASIEAAIDKADRLPVEVTVSRSANAIQIAACPGPAQALRIVYDPEHLTKVGAGENDGEQLREYRIVRAVEVVAEWDGAVRELAVRPPRPGQGQVILVQSPDLRIMGAADQPPG